ncbi:MAG TPA: RNA 2',3'-cyclic phosphodiesterase [Candidatus Acidoferrales bacterium]|nr:RNA 2',3'-cyclic phosphodiesterase [Candidatus Acidoferrales bacterium]
MRVFVALDVPEEVRAALRDVIARVRESGGGARWVRPEGMHITLKFIGETPEAMIPPIRDALAGLRSRSHVEMIFRGLGFFPDARRPRVFWAGIECSPNLGEIAAGVERALEPLGFPREARPFQPHLTLARLEARAGAGGLREAVERLGAAEFGTARAEEFYLYQSVLKPSGAEYTRLASFRFVEDAAA